MVKRSYSTVLLIPALIASFLAPLTTSSAASAKTLHKTVYRYVIRRSMRAYSNRIQLPAGTEKSSNWAGYAVTASDNTSPYHLISGNWTVPIAYGTSGALGAQWIGLGGYSSSDLLQMGTIEEMSGSREVVQLFWEKLPAAAQNLGTVPVGSQISTSIGEASDGKWTLNFTIVTPKGKKSTKTVTTTLDAAYQQGVGTSAEWISEDPSDGSGNLYPLADTGTLTYTNALTDNAALTASGNTIHPLAVTNAASRLLLVPSNLSADGTSFTTQNTQQRDFIVLKGLQRHRFRISHHKHFIR